jgi:hypothetical protein
LPPSATPTPELDRGSLLGVATRNVFVGIVGGAIVKYLIDRFYWYDEEASWRNITPEVLACGGVVAVVLVIVLGGPGGGQAVANPALVGDCSESQRNPQQMLSSLGVCFLPARPAEPLSRARVRPSADRPRPSRSSA